MLVKLWNSFWPTQSHDISRTSGAWNASVNSICTSTLLLLLLYNHKAQMLLIIILFILLLAKEKNLSWLTNKTSHKVLNSKIKLYCLIFSIFTSIFLFSYSHVYVEWTKRYLFTAVGLRLFLWKTNGGYWIRKERHVPTRWHDALRVAACVHVLLFILE